MPRPKKSNATLGSSEPKSTTTAAPTKADGDTRAVHAVAAKRAAKKAKQVAPRATKPAAKSAISASDFIKSQPMATPAKRVVVAGKERGLKFSEGLVYMVRLKLKAKHAAKAAPKQGAKKSGGKPGAKLTRGAKSASAFIRSQPTKMFARDVVAAGAKLGLKFSEGLVYNVRAASRKRAAKKNAAIVAPKPIAAATPATVRVPASSHAVTFRKLVLELGLTEAKVLLTEVERKLAALIAG